MADDESIRNDASGAERRKITKKSTEYRKTESESHEVERAGDYEKRVVSSESRETSVERSESVEIRRASAALAGPATPAANWHASMPATVRLSINGVQPDTCSDAALFDGDYILELADAHADGCRWEVSFDAHCRLYRAALTAMPGFGWFELRAELQGAVPGPRWAADAAPGFNETGFNETGFNETLTLRLDPNDNAENGAVAAGCRWPEIVTVMPIRTAPAQEKHDISPAPTVAEQAAMAALVTPGSSSAGHGGPDHTTDCHCVCTCGCTAGGAMTPNSAPFTSVSNSPMHVDPDSARPVRYGNGELRLAVTDLSSAGFGDEFGHTRIFSNRLGGDIDYGNGFNWLVRQLPILVQQGANTIMVVRGTRSALWFDLVGGANPGYFDDFNNWKTKTVETRPDGSVNTVYANYVQDVILKQLAGAGDAWIEAVHFNDRADVDQYAYPSAVAGFDDTQNDLAIAYNATSGLVRLYAYYGDTAPGYMQSESVQQGTAGTPVLLKDYQYTQVAAGGVMIYPTVAVIVYRDDAATQPLLTSFGYMFHPGTTAVQERTTTWSVVAADQNGSEPENGSEAENAAEKRVRTYRVSTRCDPFFVPESGGRS